MTPHGKQRERKIKRPSLVGHEWEHGRVLSEYSIGYWNVECRHCGEVHQYETRSVLKKAHTKKCDKYHPHNYTGNDFDCLRLRRYYGITLAVYNEMLEKQGGVCAICGNVEPVKARGLSVDHCHSTNAVRGLLCSFCNMALGLFKDNTQRLRSAAEYLEKTNVSA